MKDRRFKAIQKRARKLMAADGADTTEILQEAEDELMLVAHAFNQADQKLVGIARVEGKKSLKLMDQGKVVEAMKHAESLKTRLDGFKAPPQLLPASKQPVNDLEAVNPKVAREIGALEDPGEEPEEAPQHLHVVHFNGELLPAPPATSRHRISDEFMRKHRKGALPVVPMYAPDAPAEAKTEAFLASAQIVYHMPSGERFVQDVQRLVPHQRNSLYDYFLASEAMQGDALLADRIEVAIFSEFDVDKVMLGIEKSDRKRRRIADMKFENVSRQTVVEKADRVAEEAKPFDPMQAMAMSELQRAMKPDEYQEEMTAEVFGRMIANDPAAYGLQGLAKKSDTTRFIKVRAVWIPEVVDNPPVPLKIAASYQESEDGEYELVFQDLTGVLKSGDYVQDFVFKGSKASPMEWMIAASRAYPNGILNVQFSEGDKANHPPEVQKLVGMAAATIPCWGEELKSIEEINNTSKFEAMRDSLDMAIGTLPIVGFVWDAANSGYAELTGKNIFQGYEDPALREIGLAISIIPGVPASATKLLKKAKNSDEVIAALRAASKVGFKNGDEIIAVLKAVEEYDLSVASDLAKRLEVAVKNDNMGEVKAILEETISELKRLEAFGQEALAAARAGDEVAPGTAKAGDEGAALPDKPDDVAEDLALSAHGGGGREYPEFEPAPGSRQADAGSGKGLEGDELGKAGDGVEDAVETTPKLRGTGDIAQKNLKEALRRDYPEPMPGHYYKKRGNEFDHEAMPGTDESYMVVPSEKVKDGVEVVGGNEKWAFVKRARQNTAPEIVGESLEDAPGFVFESLVVNSGSSFNPFVRVLEKLGVAEEKGIRTVLQDMDGAGKLRGRSLDDIRHELKERYKPGLYEKIGCRYADSNNVTPLSGMTNQEAHAAFKKILEVKDGEKMLNSADLGNIGERWYKARYLDGQEVYSEVTITREMVEGLSNDPRRIDHVVKGEDGNLQAVEVKAGAGPIDESQLNDYVKMRGKDVPFGEVDEALTKVKYAFLNPDGLVNNRALLFETLQRADVKGLEIEVHLADGTVKSLTSKDAVHLATPKRLDAWMQQ